MKYIILVPDGAADCPLKDLDGRTPLQAARKPAMDALAERGRTGLLKTIPDGFPSGSEVANLSILGYDPRNHYHGRGVLEAAAMGVTLRPDDIALRCNVIYVENEQIGNHSAGHISSKEAEALIRDCDRILGSGRVRFHPGVSYRHLLVLSGGYCEHVECFPPHDHVGESLSRILPRPLEPSAGETAELLNRVISDSRELLETHPINIERTRLGKDPGNCLWPWSPGRRPDMRTYRERFGMTGAVITAVDLLRGLGVYCGFDIIRVEGATGLYDTHYEGKAEACLRALETHDLVYVHVEAPDEAGHEGNADLKLRCIEDFDRRLLGPILSGVERTSVKIALLPDHATPCTLRSHQPDPVPFCIAGPGVEPDDVVSFDEASCRGGGYGLREGTAFIELLLGRQENRQTETGAGEKV